MKQRKKVFWIVIGVAMISLLVAVVVNKSVRRAHDGNESTAVEKSSPKMDSAGHAEGSSAALHQDKTAPESPSAKTEESEHAPHEPGIGQSANKDNGVPWVQAAAIEYDRNGQIGEPPEGWKEDYSHWDLRYNANDLEAIGLVKGTGGIGYIFQPTEEARLRMSEIQREISKAAEEGLLTQESKSVYVRRVLEDGEMAVYAAPDYIEHYDALLKEMKQINVRHMQETSDRAFSMFSEMSTAPEYSKVAVRHYRRDDGSLMREVTLPSGEMKTFVAGPPPDLSRYSEEAIEYMKGHWGGTEKTQTSGDSHNTYQLTVTPVTDP